MNVIDRCHADVKELERVLDRGFESPERRSQVFLCLATRCAPCARSLQELLGRPGASGKRPPTCDPVVGTLRDWVDVRRYPRKAVDLRPMYRFWINRERFQPLDFCRAALEQSRQLAIDDPDAAIRIFESLHKDFSSETLGSRGGCGVHDLRNGALTSLARAWADVLDLDEADKHMEAAKRELGLGSGDREVLATLYEHEAEIARLRGQQMLSSVLLDAAVALLRNCPVPGRLAEVLVRMGIGLLQQGCGYQAAEILREARVSLPEDVYPRLLLEVLHHQALADVRNRDFNEALKHLALAKAKSLYKLYPLEPMATQRFWILGISYFHVDREDKAEAALQEALQRYCQLGEWGGAAHSLTLLASLYVSQSRGKDLEGLEQDFSKLIRKAPMRQLAQQGLRKAIRLATILKVPVPRLRKDLDELAMKDSPPPRIN
jgi:tetratricopeptide (TPR) repeat protein